MTAILETPPLRDIARLRKKAGLTQKELASKVGIKPPTMNKIEKGRLQPSYKIVCQIFAVLRNHLETDEKKLDDIITKDVLMATPKWTIEKAINEMSKHDYGQIPVQDGGRIIGTITERSLSRYVLRGGRTDVSVVDAMDDPLPQLPGQTSVRVAESLFYMYPGVLVVDSKGVVGIVTRADTYAPAKQ